MLYLFAGPRRPGDVQEHLEAYMSAYQLPLLMLSVDLATNPSWDLSWGPTRAIILGVTLDCLLDGILTSPPCSTWSLLRFRPGGPPPLRTRDKFAWGLPILSGPHKDRVAEASVLAAGAVACVEAIAKVTGVGLLEHLDDPGTEPYPSIFATDLLKGASQRIGGRFASLDQGALGAPVPKGTTLWGTVDRLQSCDGIRDTRHPSMFMKQRRDESGGFMSRRLATYPSQFCQLIAWTFAQSFLRMSREGSGPTSLSVPRSTLGAA